VAIIGTSRSLAISRSRRKFLTCALRVHSSGEDQLNTGLNVQILTPEEAMAFLTFTMSALLTFG